MTGDVDHGARAADSIMSASTTHHGLTQAITRRCSHCDKPQPITAFAILVTTPLHSRATATTAMHDCTTTDRHDKPHTNENQMTKTTAIQLNNSHTITHTNRRHAACHAITQRIQSRPVTVGSGRGGGVVRHRVSAGGATRAHVSRVLSPLTWGVHAAWWVCT
jgi:hypothetical protein